MNTCQRIAATVLAAFGLCPVGAVGNAAAAPVLDQQVLEDAGFQFPADISVLYGPQAQTFTPSVSGQLHSVDFRIGSSYPGPAAAYPLTVLIREVTVLGEPLGVVLGSVEIAAPYVGWNRAVLADQSVFLTQGESYAIVFANEDDSSAYPKDYLYAVYREEAGPYPGGMLWPDEFLDAVFRTWMMPAAPPTQCGDYNGNGSVGPEDYEAWKAAFGQTAPVAADGNGNGSVDAADYTVWRDHLGQTVSGANIQAAASIPEPADLVLLAIATVVLGGFGQRSRRFPPIICLATMTFIFSSGTAVGQSYLDLNDGGSHTLDYDTGDGVSVRVDLAAPGTGTQLEVVESGRVGQTLYAYEDSAVTISGGELRWVTANDRSRVAFQGGTIDGPLWATEESVVSVAGGVVAGPLVAHDSPLVAMSGGTIEMLDAYENSSITVSGGSIGPNLRTNVAVTSWDESRITISGGTIQGKIHAGWYANAGPSAIIFKGSQFAVDGIPVGYGEIRSVHGGHWPDEPVRTLTGVLSGGDAINNDFYISGNAKIVLVPEPSTIGLVVLGLLGVIAVWR